jgi:hypothetical protein
MTIDGNACEQVQPSAAMHKRGERYMQPWGASERDRPGYWVKLTSRTYAYREHTGDITYWRTQHRRAAK